MSAPIIVALVCHCIRDPTDSLCRDDIQYMQHLSKSHNTCYSGPSLPLSGLFFILATCTVCSSLISRSFWQTTTAAVSLASEEPTVTKRRVCVCVCVCVVCVCACRREGGWSSPRNMKPSLYGLCYSLVSYT